MTFASNASVINMPTEPSAHLSTNPSTYWALIPCAGEGIRALGAGNLRSVGQNMPRKQYQLIAGLPMVLHTIAAFARVDRVPLTLVAVSPGDVFLDDLLASSCALAPCGGATRADTVREGLRALKARGACDADWVLVHDAARCLVTSDQINRLIDACTEDAVGGLLAHKMTDTLKSAGASGSDGALGIRALATLDRDDKWLAQTPQMFRLGALLGALEQSGPSVTDESSAMEALGYFPKLVPSGALNFKVTFPEDFALAEAVLLQRRIAAAAHADTSENEITVGTRTATAGEQIL